MPSNRPLTTTHPSHGPNRSLQKLHGSILVSPADCTTKALRFEDLDRLSGRFDLGFGFLSVGSVDSSTPVKDGPLKDGFASDGGIMSVYKSLSASVIVNTHLTIIFTYHALRSVGILEFSIALLDATVCAPKYWRGPLRNQTVFVVFRSIHF